MADLKPSASVSAWLALVFPSTLWIVALVVRLVFVKGPDQFALQKWRRGIRGEV